MADRRIFVWYLEEIIGNGIEQGPVYMADREYVPVALKMNAKRAPDAADMTVNILDDGVTILQQQARLRKNGESEDVAENFARTVTIAKGSLIQLDITPSGAKGITVELECEATDTLKEQREEEA